ncbi:hypothetical protein LC085_17160 [Bacillus tianshenii]|uniref:hypothetical protein n=1 Tax=Sutcliffiella tianshenii TaxID=1463404 RepID=UPI001CD1A91C|nr:hypothetical protein [Bacillus tianshenii]MCA1321638.1 hypothetical protein [Bacillus tianshenii]
MIIAFLFFIVSTVNSVTKNITVNTDALNEEKEKILGSIPEAKLTFYAQENEGNLVNFRMSVNGQTKYFPYWRNVSNETYAPQFLYNDINGDGKKELIVILTQGYGTGILEQNVHVLHQARTNAGEAYREIIVDGPRTILLRNVRTNLTKSEAIITILNRKKTYNIEKIVTGPEGLFSNIVTDNLISYEVVKNHLIAKMGAQIGPGIFIGSFYITYEFKDGFYQMESIEFRWGE